MKLLFQINLAHFLFSQFPKDQSLCTCLGNQSHLNFGRK